jgi:hypothetical protein
VNAKNCFYVLELAPDAAPADIERQARKLLGMLELGIERSARYACPVGEFERDATMVREALARLRDPKTRLREATLARALVGETKQGDEDPDAPLRGGFLVGGFRGL